MKREIKRNGLHITFLIFVLLLMACNSESATDDTAESEGTDDVEESHQEDTEEDTQQTEDNGNEGGVLDVAYDAEPLTLDPHNQTANATRETARHIYETLVVLNSDFEVVPMLAESFEVSDEGPITFQLREGVSFHNGEEMTAEDVAASMNKWLDTPHATANIGEDAVFEEISDYEVVLNGVGPSPLLMTILAEVGQFPAIMPKDVVEDVNEAGNVTEFIGTGPYQLEEWSPDQHMHLTRFEDYSSLSEEPDGLAGAKHAYLDEIYFHFIQDSSTRVSGMLTGDFDFARSIPNDNYEMLEEDPNIVTDIWPFGFEILIFNKAEGLFTDVNARKAVNMALDKEEILTAAFTDEQFFELDPAYFIEDQPYYTDAGAEHYNQNNPSEAEALLAETDYDGEEILILTSREYDHHYNAAVTTQQHLEQIGMNVTLDVYDWATVLDRRNDPGAYDIVFTAISTAQTPHQLPFLDSRQGWAGFSDSPDIDRMLDEMHEQPDEESAIEVYEELQAEAWDYLPVINLGKDLRVNAHGDHVQGYEEFTGLILWNATVE